ncbi:hypothetical protein AURDEDRAFT_150835, partial [Auricularia subglabra TFB-10046 SS5]
MHATVSRDRHFVGAGEAARVALSIHAAAFHNGINHANAYRPSIPAGRPRTIVHPPPRGSPVVASTFTFKPPPLSPVHPAWRAPLHPLVPSFALYSQGSPAAVAGVPGASPPTLPPIRALVGGGKHPDCTRPTLNRPFFKPTPMKQVPQSAMVTSGNRWLDDADLNISWCILPPPTWPTRQPTEQGNSSACHQEDHFPGASPPEAAEQARPRLMSISALLRSDPASYDAVSASTGSPSSSVFSSPLSSPPSSPESSLHRPLAKSGSSSPLSSPSSSEDDPLMAMARTRVQLPGIAALNLPTPMPKNISPRTAVRPVAGRRPKIEHSGSDSEAARQVLQGGRSPSIISSGLSSPEVEVDELADDDDEYKPPSSSGKRKARAAREDTLPLRKKGPGPPATRRHQCDECPQVFYYDSHYNKHKVAHAKKNGKNSKPFHCLRCNQGFGRIWDLERHLFTHSGKKPYQCNYC